MSIKVFKLNKSLIVLAILLGAFLMVPLCYAGGAATLVPAEDIDVPQGSNLPEHRTKALKQKVQEHKAKLRQRALEKQQEQVSQEENSQKPEAPDN